MTQTTAICYGTLNNRDVQVVCPSASVRDAKGDFIFSNNSPSILCQTNTPLSLGTSLTKNFKTKNKLGSLSNNFSVQYSKLGAINGVLSNVTPSLQKGGAEVSVEIQNINDTGNILKEIQILRPLYPLHFHQFTEIPYLASLLFITLDSLIISFVSFQNKVLLLFRIQKAM
jgi:hypothetical protein